MEDNNIDGKIANLRDTFLEAEREYFNELMKKGKWKRYVEALNKLDARKLAEYAINRIDCIENGKVKEKDLESVETEITLILAAIQDCARERGERVRTDNAGRIKSQESSEEEYER